MVGVEKLFGPDKSDSFRALNGAVDTDYLKSAGIDAGSQSVFIASIYPKRLARYQGRYGLEARTLAEIAVKNRHNAALNPGAQYRDADFDRRGSRGASRRGAADRAYVRADQRRSLGRGGHVGKAGPIARVQTGLDTRHRGRDGRAAGSRVRHHQHRSACVRRSPDQTGRYRRRGGARLHRVQRRKTEKSNPSLWSLKILQEVTNELSE